MTPRRGATPDEPDDDDIPWTPRIDYDQWSSSFTLTVANKTNLEWNTIQRREYITCNNAKYHVGDIVNVEIIDEPSGTRLEPAVIAECQSPFVLVAWIFEANKRKGLLKRARIAPGYEFILTTYTDVIHKSTLRDRISLVDQICVTAVLHFTPRQRVIKLQDTTDGDCYMGGLAQNVSARYSLQPQVQSSRHDETSQATPVVKREIPSNNKRTSPLSAYQEASISAPTTPEHSSVALASPDLDYESSNDDFGSLASFHSALTTLSDSLGRFSVDETPRKLPSLPSHLTSSDLESPAEKPTPRASSARQGKDRRSPRDTFDSPWERSSYAEASPSKTIGFEVLPPNPPPSPKHLQLVSIRLLEASITRNIKLCQNYKGRRYVYVFTAPKLPGLAKVGIAEDVGKRRRDLERGCRLGTVELQYMSKSLQLAPLAEKLTHGVLKAWGFGRIVKCPTENTKHGEWFACGKEMAVEVVKIWSEALEYDERGTENWLIERVKHFEKDGAPSEDHETWDQMMDRHRRWFRAGRGGRLDWLKVIYRWYSS